MNKYSAVYKVVTIVKGQVWDVVCMDNPRIKVEGWFSKACAESCAQALNNGERIEMFQDRR